MKIWLAGFGNQDREDDGAGILLAGFIADFLTNAEGVDLELCLEHQLLPELALEMTDADLAIFCDADMTMYESGFSMREAKPKAALDGFNIHSMGAEWLLALAEQIGASPKSALLLTVSGDSFDFSDKPTKACMERINNALCEFKKFFNLVIKARTDGYSSACTLNDLTSPLIQ